MSGYMDGWVEFNRRYPTLIEAIGERCFLEKLSELITYIVDYESLVVIGFGNERTPILIYNDTNFFSEQSRDKEFMNALVLDPFYQLIRRGVREGVYKLDEIAPDDFYQSDYYRQIYKKTGIQQEVGLIVTCTEEFTLVLSAGLRGKPR